VDLASALLAQQRVDEAAEVLAEARALRPDDPRILARAGYAAARGGDRAAARHALATLEAQGRTRYVTPVDPAIVLLALGRHDEALARLEQAHAARDTWVPWLRCWPLFDELRGEGRFERVIPGMGG
jgi:tetratricopeptide (TPR) repeat protein